MTPASRVEPAEAPVGSAGLDPVVAGTGHLELGGPATGLDRDLRGMPVGGTTPAGG